MLFRGGGSRKEVDAAAAREERGAAEPIIYSHASEDTYIVACIVV